ncbi:MAG: hypothetical protein US88_C0014G0007 [Parcubacteria group bacterium GW2011_GWA2_38_27]|nr:MAG: hypothetical protein US88_C0014G0007 [Parcubacteria group bacterium GW2011_GWA2_38_27]
MVGNRWAHNNQMEKNLKEKEKLAEYFLRGLALAVLIISPLIIFPARIFAYQIEKINLAGTLVGDFVLSPGKIELWMEPGEKITKVISVTNRTGAEMNFKIEIEDFKGSYEPENPIVFLGGEEGLYSLKNYLKPEVSEFTLKYGEKITIPVEISIPKNIEPGGLYGSALVETNPSEEQSAGMGTEVKVVSRLGALFFVRISGNAIEQAVLKDFRTEKLFYKKGHILFSAAIENKGNVHLVPYGIIGIKNIFGREVGKIEVDPWFVMPDSVRTREIQWDKPWLFGRYEATLKVNRGYQDIIDEEMIYFWVLPWKMLAIGGAGLIILLGAIIFIIKRK